jgi:hypothetical protein
VILGTSTTKPAPQNVPICTPEQLIVTEPQAAQIGGTARVLVDPAVSLSVLLK